MSAANHSGATRALVRVTSHARQRFLERVDTEHPYPASAIREVWAAVRDGRRDDRGVELVYERRGAEVVIITVCRAGGDRSEVRAA